MCSNEISTRFPGTFYLFLWYFFLLENSMCSCRILRKLSWKFWCVLVTFLVLLENLMCSYKRIMSSYGKFICFLLHSSLLENLMCSRNLLYLKLLLEKKNRYFSKIGRRLFLKSWKQVKMIQFLRLSYCTGLSFTALYHNFGHGLEDLYLCSYGFCRNIYLF